MNGEKEKEIVEVGNFVELGTSHVTKLANKSSIKKKDGSLPLLHSQTK